MLGLKLNHISKRGHWCVACGHLYKIYFVDGWLQMSSFVHIWSHILLIDGLAWDCGNSIADVLDLLQPWAKPLICIESHIHVKKYGVTCNLKHYIYNCSILWPWYQIFLCKYIYIIIPPEQRSCWGVYWFLYPLNNEVVGGYIGFTPSVRPSVRPACRVCSVTSTVLDGFFPY